MILGGRAGGGKCPDFFHPFVVGGRAAGHAFGYEGGEAGSDTGYCQKGGEEGFWLTEHDAGLCMCVLGGVCKY